jgi:DNA-binding CsgD family transcriptional regulator
MVALLERLLEAGNRAVVMIDQSRRIRQSSGRAAALLVAYRGSEISQGDSLPPTIDAWVKWCGRLDGLEHGHAHNQPLVIYGEHGRLVIRFLPRGEIGAYDALLLEQVASADQVRLLKRLSVRENQVLGWVVRGKTNPQIARILSVSAGTVQKHLEHIYDKLGVRTRAAAAVALAGFSALDEI